MNPPAARQVVVRVLDPASNAARDERVVKRSHFCFFAIIFRRLSSSSTLLPVISGPFGGRPLATDLLL